MKRARPLQRSRPKAVNRKRKAREFARAYGSVERVAWVKTLPCVSCGLPGDIQNVHVRGGGAGRKADYRHIVPMCPDGHADLHREGKRWFEQTYDLNLDQLAAQTEAAWLTHSGALPMTPDTPSTVAELRPQETALSEMSLSELKSRVLRDVGGGDVLDEVWSRLARATEDARRWQRVREWLRVRELPRMNDEPPRIFALELSDMRFSQVASELPSVEAMIEQVIDKNAWLDEQSRAPSSSQEDPE